MYLSLNWLRDYVDIPKNIKPEELAWLLTKHTVEIDGVETQADKFKNIVVGKVLEVLPHPNADRLQLAKVDIGSEILDIVCGAPNLAKNQLVPLALIGAVLPNGQEIKEAKVRGEKSYGMICAEDELGIGKDHSGIMVLDEKAKKGQKFSEYLKMNDTIFEVDNKSITNRPDLWGHYGIAREIACFLDKDFKKYKYNLEKILDKKNIFSQNKTDLKIKVNNYDDCPRYMAISFSNIVIDSSPKWMQERLIASGLKPINNIVDITNYIMLDFGQPMHAFDADFVDKIIIRRAEKDEILKTLDGEERKLNQNDLVIANRKKVIALAGIMGGENSEISNQSTRVIFEIANFNPVLIRKTSQRLNLRTDASNRFEKSLDPNLCEMAMHRLIELVIQICPQAKISSELIDLKSKKENFGFSQGPILLNLIWLKEIIGADIQTDKIIKILNKLGFETGDVFENEINVKIPTWRATKDVSIREDLLEEVARIYGYDNIAEKLPKIEMKTPIINFEKKFIRKLKNILSQNLALNEVYNYSFVNENQLSKLKIDYSSYIKLANPISSRYTLLRQSIMPNLLENLKLNQFRFDNIELFEIGNLCFDVPGKFRKNKTNDEVLPHQEKKLGILIADDNADYVFNRAKEIVAYLIKYFKFEPEFAVAEFAYEFSDKKFNTKIIVEKNEIGELYKINKDILKSNGLKKEVAIIEMNVSLLQNLFTSFQNISYNKHSKYPPAVRDLAFVISNKILYNDIKKEIENAGSLVSKVELFDVYEGDNLGKDKKSLAFHITYQSFDRTLTSEEVDEQQKNIIQSLKHKFDAQIRDF